VAVQSEEKVEKLLLAVGSSTAGVGAHIECWNHEVHETIVHQDACRSAANMCLEVSSAHCSIQAATIQWCRQQFGRTLLPNVDM
jgi:hypothetical protein